MHTAGCRCTCLPAACRSRETHPHTHPHRPKERTINRSKTSPQCNASNAGRRRGPPARRRRLAGACAVRRACGRDRLTASSTIRCGVLRRRRTYWQPTDPLWPPDRCAVRGHAQRDRRRIDYLHGWHGNDDTSGGRTGTAGGWMDACTRVLVPCQEGTEAPTGRAAIESMSGLVRYSFRCRCAMQWVGVRRRCFGLASWACLVWCMLMSIPATCMHVRCARARVRCMISLCVRLLGWLVHALAVWALGHAMHSAHGRVCP